MVIESLLAYLRSQPSCKAVLKLRGTANALREQTGKDVELVCDAVPVILWLFGSLDSALTSEGLLPSYSCLYGGSFHKYAERLIAFVKALRYLEVEPVFFLPAAPGCDKTMLSLSLPVLKARYLKRLERMTLIQQICLGSAECWRVSRSMHPLVLLQSVMTLTSQKVKVIQCLGHNHAEMAAYTSSNLQVIGILSTNSDLAVIEGSIFIDTNEFDLDRTLGVNKASINESPSDVMCTFVTPTSLANTIGTSVDRLTYLAIICGNDYTRELNKELHLAEKLKLKDLTVANVAQWIAKTEEIKPLDFFPDHTQYKKAVRESYALYSGKYKQSSKIPSLCQYLKGRIKVGKLTSSTFYGVASSSVYFRQTVVELSSVGQLSTEELILPLRKISYILLSMPSVKEYGHSSVQEFTEDMVMLSSHSPNSQLLQTIHGYSYHIRISLFFRLICSVKEVQNDSTVKQLLEKATQDKCKEVSLKCVFTAASFAVFLRITESRSDKLSPKEQDAILVTLLLCQSDFPLFGTNTCPSVSSISTSMCFSQLLETMYELASLLGLQSQLPQPKNLFYPLVSIPLILASSRPEADSANLTIARNILDRVLQIPAVVALRKVCHTLSIKHVSLKEVNKLYHAAMLELSSLSDIIPRVSQKNGGRPIHGKPDLQTSGCLNSAASPTITSPPGFLSSDRQQESLVTLPLSTKLKFKREPSKQQVSSPSLPILEFKETILDLLKQYEVTCIVGEAGCGKSTMVPQFIFDTSLNSNARVRKSCRILVCQPRRVAAVRLAHRVSQMRGVPCGRTVGYTIGGEKSLSSNCKIVYCTYGYLLQQLVHNPSSIKTYSHIILDEIHERSIDTDFVMTIIRKIAPELAPKVKIVIMSATMQGPLLVRYFREVFKKVSEPLFVGFKRYPVEEIFIDELFKLCMDEKKCFCDAQLHACQRLTVLSRRDANNAFSEMEWNKTQPAISTYAHEVCTELIISQSVLGSSVLIFFPGISEIIDYLDVFNYELHARKIEWLFQTFILHSQVPLEDQQAAFEPPPPTMVNIVLATDIAESSVTLPALQMVINFGIHHVPEYNYKSRSTQLVKKWCSKASCSQRAGRVGRVCNGLAVHLFPLQFYEEVLSAHNTSEMLSVSLTKLILQASEFTHLMGMNRLSEFLCLAPEPPSLHQLQAALNELVQVGAVTTATSEQEVSDANMRVTLIGKFALQLPLDVELSRLILFGILFGCPVEGVVIAAYMSLHRHLIDVPISQIFKNEDEYLLLLRKSIDVQFFFDGNSYSDLIQVCHVFHEWFDLRLLYGANQSGIGNKMKAAKHFGKVYAIRPATLIQFESSIAEIASSVVSILPKDSLASQQVNILASLVSDWKRDSGKAALDCEFCEDINIVRALIVASFDRGILHGERLLNSKNESLKKGAQYGFSGLTDSGFNEAATFIVPYGADKVADLKELASKALGSTPFRTCAFQKNGLIEVGGVELLEKQKNLKAFWDNESFVNSPPTEVKDLLLLMLYSRRKGKFQGDILFKFSHPYLVKWNSLLMPDSTVKCPVFPSRTSYIYDFSSSPAPLLAVAANTDGSSGSLWVQHLTILPSLERSKLGILLLLAFQPYTASVYQLVDHQRKVVKAIKINSTEFDFGNWQSILVSDLLIINQLRQALSSLIVTEQAPFPSEETISSIQKLVAELLDRVDSTVDDSSTTLSKLEDAGEVQVKRSGKKSTKSNPASSSSKKEDKLMLFYPPLKCSLLNDVSVTASRLKKRQVKVVKAPLLTPIPESNEANVDISKQECISKTKQPIVRILQRPCYNTETNTEQKSADNFKDNKKTPIAQDYQDTTEQHYAGWLRDSTEAFIESIKRNAASRQAKNEVVMDTVIDQRDTVTDQRDTVIDKRDTVTDQRGAVTDQRDTVIDKRDTVTDQRDTVTDQRDTVIDKRDTVTDQRNTVTDQRGAVTDQRNTVTDQSASEPEEYYYNMSVDQSHLNPSAPEFVPTCSPARSTSLLGMTPYSFTLPRPNPNPIHQVNHQSTQVGYPKMSWYRPTFNSTLQQPQQTCFTNQLQHPNLQQRYPSQHFLSMYHPAFLRKLFPASPYQPHPSLSTRFPSQMVSPTRGPVYRCRHNINPDNDASRHFVSQHSGDNTCQVSQHSDKNIAQVSQHSDDNISLVSDNISQISRNSDDKIDQVSQNSDNNIASDDNITQVSQHFDDNITQVSQHSDDNITQVSQHSEDNISQVSQHFDDNITQVSQHSDDNIAQVSQHSDDNISQVSQHSDDNITQVSQHSDDNISQVSQHSDDNISQVSQHSDDNISQVSQHSDDNITQVSQHSDDNVSQVSQHSDDNITQVSQHSDCGISLVSQYSDDSISHISQHLDCNNSQASQHDSNTDQCIDSQISQHRNTSDGDKTVRMKQNSCAHNGLSQRNTTGESSSASNNFSYAAITSTTASLLPDTSGDDDNVTEESQWPVLEATSKREASVLHHHDDTGSKKVLTPKTTTSYAAVLGHRGKQRCYKFKENQAYNSGMVALPLSQGKRCTQSSSNQVNK